MVDALNFDFSLERANKHGKPTKYEMGRLYFHRNSGELHVCIAKFEAGPMMCAIGRYNKPKVVDGTMFVPAMLKPIQKQGGVMLSGSDIDIDPTITFQID